MSFIVTAEATRKVRVAQVVFVCAPRNLEIRKYIFVVNGEDCLGCYVHVRGPALNECGLRLSIKLMDCSRDLSSRFFAGRILGAQYFDTFLPDKGQGYRNPADCH